MVRPSGKWSGASDVILWASWLRKLAIPEPRSRLNLSHASTRSRRTGAAHLAGDHHHADRAERRWLAAYLPNSPPR